MLVFMVNLWDIWGIDFWIRLLLFKGEVEMVCLVNCFCDFGESGRLWGDKGGVYFFLICISVGGFIDKDEGEVWMWLFWFLYDVFGWVFWIKVMIWLYKVKF